VEITGDTAAVYTQIVTRQPVGATRYVETRVPQAFAMIKESGGWRVADDLFVEARANALARAQQSQGH
jgi:hypothetical protein